MRYQINIIEYDADMEEIRKACADLLEPDQLNESGDEINAIYIDTSTATVSEAVRRIKALGYSTDEDSTDENEMIKRVEIAYDVIASLVDQKSVEYISSDAYITFTPGEVVIIEDDNRKAYTYAPLVDPARTSVEDFSQEIYMVLPEVFNALNTLPEGNIEQYGGKSGIIKTLYDAFAIKHHVARLSM